MKVCSKCKIKKDESEFYKHKNKKDGLKNLCKECSYQNKESKEFCCLCGCGERSITKVNARFLNKKHYHKWLRESVKLIEHPCECGCKELTKNERFVKGHNAKVRNITEETKKKSSESKLGSKNPMYGKRHTEEWKQKQREFMLSGDMALKNRDMTIKMLEEGKIGWQLTRQAKEGSYPENLFKNFLTDLGLQENIDFTREYHLLRYSLDFAFLKYNFYVEIDGKFHLDEKHILHDKKRKEDINLLGWNEIRITVTNLRFILREIYKNIDKEKILELLKYKLQNNIFIFFNKISVIGRFDSGIILDFIYE